MPSRVTPSTNVTTPRVYSIAPILWSWSAASVILARRTPSIIAKNSCVRKNCGLPTRSPSSLSSGHTVQARSATIPANVCDCGPHILHSSGQKKSLNGLLAATTHGIVQIKSAKHASSYSAAHRIFRLCRLRHGATRKCARVATSSDSGTRYTFPFPGQWTARYSI